MLCAGEREQRSEQQRERTREEFGSEYERTAEARGSEEEAERELRERRGRVERQVEPLSEESRGRYEERWGEVERVFVDNPSRSIELADRTVMEILEERNFVSDQSQSDEETERSLAVMHPDVADDYREARRIRADVVAGVGRFSEELRGGDHGGAPPGHPEVPRSLQATRERVVAVREPPLPAV